MTGLFQSTSIPVLLEVVKFTKARHAVLAGNIANIDTPGYQARDLSVEDFQRSWSRRSKIATSHRSGRLGRRNLHRNP